MSDPIASVPAPNYEVRLKAGPEAEWHRATVWCEDNVDQAAGHLWARRVEYGPERDQPQALVFTFNNESVAAAFKLACFPEDC